MCKFPRPLIICVCVIRPYGPYHYRLPHVICFPKDPHNTHHSLIYILLLSVVFCDAFRSANWKDSNTITPCSTIFKNNTTKYTNKKLINISINPKCLCFYLPTLGKCKHNHQQNTSNLIKPLDRLVETIVEQNAKTTSNIFAIIFAITQTICVCVVVDA